MKIKLHLIAVSCLLLASGCTHYLHPENAADLDQRLRDVSGKIRDFHGSGSVTLVNGQTADDQYLFFKAGGHSHYGNRREWTDAIIRLTERELAKRGLHISGNGKRVTMAVESIQTEPGFWTADTKAVLKVQVGGGFSATYTGTSTGGNLGNLSNESLVNAVAEMLNDSRFVAAITK